MRASLPGPNSIDPGRMPNNSRGFLELRLAHRIQELTYGGVARETTKLLNALADEVEGKPGRKSMIAIR
jgi:hypothetical protein